jgi:hypothetical protein
MPINYKDYPSNWFTEIRPSVLKRSGGKCEMCGVSNYAVGYRDEDGCFRPTCGNIVHDLAGQGLSYPSLQPLSYKEAKELADVNNEFRDDEEGKYIVIVLTIAHLNHDVTCNDLSNLAALCQRCHNRHDVSYRKANRKESRKKSLGIIELFDQGDA